MTLAAVPQPDRLRTPRRGSDASGHRSTFGTHCHTDGIPPTVGYRVPPVAPRLTVHAPNGRRVRRPHAAPWHVGAAVYRCPMTISDEVPGEIPSSSIAAMKAGLATMGLPDLDVVVTDDFVATVQERTEDGDYHDDRNGGSVAARTVTTSVGEVVVVANWKILSTLTDAEVEWVLAHEAGHASIDARGEDAWGDVGARFPGHYWNVQVAYSAAVAIDEYRCEAAVYEAGYQLEHGRDDEGLADDLFGLNRRLVIADHEYQTHLDVARLREDVLREVVFHLRYMGTVAARHLHHDPIDPTRLNRYAQENWETLVAPTWERFVALYRAVPDAFTQWPSPAATDASVAVVDLAHDLTLSFGFEATEDAFWIRMTAPERGARRDRANGEADLLGLNA